MKKKSIFSLLVIVFIVLIGALTFFGIKFNSNPQDTSDYRIVTDMDDNRIEVPADPRRIACMHGVSFEKIVILGGADRLVLAMKASPWMLKIFPEVNNLQFIEQSSSFDVERMLDLKVDLVLYSPNPGEAEKYKSAGIKTASGFSPQKRPRNIEDYSSNFKRQTMFIGELIGADATVRAQKYCKYFDDKVSQIRSITSKIDKKDRPNVYYGGRSASPLSSQGNCSVMHWNTEIAGGNFLTQSMDNNFVDVNMEQIFAWNPDIIILSGWCDSLDIIKNNPNWASLRAVKNGKIYLLPQGVFTWDHASGESILLMIYMAKLFYPEQFKDLDMVIEMKKFYSEIYSKTVTDNEAKRMLNHLNPL